MDFIFESSGCLLGHFRQQGGRKNSPKRDGKGPGVHTSHQTEKCVSKLQNSDNYSQGYKKKTENYEVGKFV